MTTKIIIDDCREAMAAMEPNSVDAIVTDPPYELVSPGQQDRRGLRYGEGGKRTIEANRGGFMGMKWDGTGIANNPEMWREAFRVLKPGGHLVAFGGTRTSHRMVCAIEDAGFEIRDSFLYWGFGSGFPKSHNVTKAAKESGRACSCGGSALQYTHADDSRNELRDVRQAAPEDASQPPAEVLLADVRGQGEGPLSAGQNVRGVPAHLGGAHEGSGEEPHMFAGVQPSGIERAAQGQTLAAGSADRDTVRSLRQADQAVSESDEADHDAGLLLRVQRGTAGEVVDRPLGEHEGSEAKRPEIRSGESGLEGRGDVLPQEGQLQADQVRPVPAGPDRDGAQGRLRHGASAADGADDGLSADAGRGGPSRRPRSSEQRGHEPGIVADESGPQAVGRWPLCDRCRLPILPEGLGSALKPAYEPICLARKPLAGTLVDNTLAHGTGALNIDGCRIGASGESTVRPNGPIGYHGGGSGGEGGSLAGRWPANVVLSHAPDCVEVGTRRVKSQAPTYRRDAADAASDDGLIYGQMIPQPSGKTIGYADADGMETVTSWECAHGCAVAALDEAVGERKSGGITKQKGVVNSSNWRTNEGRTDSHRHGSDYERGPSTGGASRFFLNVAPIDAEDWDGVRFLYQAKASRSERSAGLQCTCYNQAWESADHKATIRRATATPRPRATTESTSTDAFGWPMSPSGSDITDQSPKGSAFITETSTNNTTTSATSKSSTTSHTSASTQGANSETVSGGSPAASVVNESPSTLVTGTSAEKAGPSTVDASRATSASSLTPSGSDGRCPNCGKITRSTHPCVKPVSLMRWLVRLVTPPGGTVLDPFAGSFTTGVACIHEGFDFVGIEQDEAYAAIGRARLAHAEAVHDTSAPLFTEVAS